jgi:hypothetical protein
MIRVNLSKSVKNTVAFTAGAGLLMSSLLMISSARAETYTYVTDFTKNNNIYTNLNQQYPNTGAGVPGSGVGVPNASYLFTPPPTGAANLENNVNNGVSFKLTSDAAGHDFEQVDGGATLSIASSVSNANVVYALVGAYDGVNASVTFTGTGGATETFSNFYIPDFNGGSINSVSPTFSDQTVFQVLDGGAGGSGNSATGDYNHYGLTELSFNLGAQFDGQTLTSTTFTSGGYETLVLGETIGSITAVSGVPEPSTWLLMGLGAGLVGLTLRHARKSQAAAIKA